MENYSEADVLAVLAGFGIAFLVFAAITYVWFGIVGTQLFKKAGYKHPWAAWVPGYNVWAFLEVGGQKGWWALVYFAGAFISVVPYIGDFLNFLTSLLLLIVTIYAIININKAFGKDTGLWTVFGFFLHLIWMTVLAYGSSQWRGAPKDGPFFLGQAAYETTPETSGGTLYGRPPVQEYHNPGPPPGYSTPYQTPPAPPFNPPTMK